MIGYFLYSMAEARRYGRVCELSDDEATGLSLWSLPLSSAEAAQKTTDKTAFMLDVMGPNAVQTYKDICKNMADMTETVTEKSDWYLSIAGVSPEGQGRGLGQQIIRPVLEDADRAGVASYLETFTKRNMTFYARLGYRPIASFDEAVTGATYWVMRREPDA